MAANNPLRRPINIADFADNAALQSAGDFQHAAADVFSLPGGQEEHCLRDLLGSAKTLQGHHLLILAALFRREIADEFSIDKARRDAIDGDFTFGDLFAERFAEGHQAGF